MELVVTIVGAIVSLATLGFKWWKARQDANKALLDIRLFEGRIRHLEDENATLRKLVAEKENQLVKAIAARTSTMSASELANLLRELFRGKQPAPGSGSL